MSTRGIETYIADLYGPGVSRQTVSRVTAGVLEDAKAWQTRPLEQIYPILYLDALIVKTRDRPSRCIFSTPSIASTPSCKPVIRDLKRHALAHVPL
jgi:transposase-like protein